MEGHEGSCLCGAVRVEVTGALDPPDACHCSQCRRQSGHAWASSGVPRGRVTVQDEETLTRYRSSETVRRGFCFVCRSFLFWEKIGKDRIAIALGAFNKPTQTQLERHIFVADKGDYFDVADGLRQNEQ